MVSHLLAGLMSLRGGLLGAREGNPLFEETLRSLCCRWEALQAAVEAVAAALFLEEQYRCEINTISRSLRHLGPYATTGWNEVATKSTTEDLV